MTAPAARARAGLAAAGRFGAFFETVGADSATEPGWIALRSLAEDPVHAGALVERAGALMTSRLDLARGAVPDRVVASIVFVSLAARLVAPAFGSAVATGTVPTVTPDDVWWRASHGGAMPLRFEPAASRHSDDLSDLAAWTVTAAVDGLVQPVLRQFATRFRLSTIVLWGNVGSGVAGAARTIALTDPPLGPRAAELATRMLELGPLAGTSDAADPHRTGWGIRRRSCCLFYRVPGSGYCGDCVLAGPRTLRSGGVDAG